MQSKSSELNGEEQPAIKESATGFPPMPEQCATPDDVYDVELQPHDPGKGMLVLDDPVDEQDAVRGAYIANNPVNENHTTSLNGRPENDGNANPSKRLKEDSMLLMKGFDSIASSISLLTGDLNSALQGARELAKPSALTEKILSSTSDPEPVGDKQENEVTKGVKRKLDGQDCCNDKGESERASENKKKQKPEMNLNKVKDLAVAMAAKSASLAKELKSVKSSMCFLQERCALLEEENQRLRGGYGKGDRPDDDDLVRLQLEALLAEKSRLATDNVNLTRENQCLRQLVEYHQFASEDLSASYEQVIQGIALDFSSPIAENDGNVEDVVTTPKTSGEIFEFPSSLDKSFADEQELHSN